MDKLQEIYAFDFDGTLTTHDTLIEITRFAAGKNHVAMWMALNAPMLVAVKLGVYPGGMAKEKMLTHFFADTPEAEFNAMCRDFALKRSDLLRPAGMDAVAKAVNAGATVLVVSASLDSWVAPFFAGFGDKVRILCTRPEVKDGLITGRFASANCNGAEKKRRILEMFPDRKSYRLTAFGDSHGDKYMLEMADEAHYKPFRQ